MTDITRDLKTIATLAVEHLLQNTPVVLTLPPNWERPEFFPLPITRDKKSKGAGAKQSYRPMALLEYVSETIDGRIKGDKIRERLAAGRANDDDDEL